MTGPALQVVTVAVALVYLALLGLRVAYLRTERWIEGGDDDR